MRCAPRRKRCATRSPIWPDGTGAPQHRGAAQCGRHDDQDQCRTGEITAVADAVHDLLIGRVVTGPGEHVVPVDLRRFANDVGPAGQEGAGLKIGASDCGAVCASRRPAYRNVGSVPATGTVLGSIRCSASTDSCTACGTVAARDNRIG